MQRFLLVCLGGAIGSGARHLIVLAAARRLGTAFPYGTLAVNLAGCFLMGATMQIAATTAMPPSLRLVLTTGFLGGLTTYSAFNHETTHLLRDGAARVALLNVGLTAFGCFAMGLLGIAVARRFAG